MEGLNLVQREALNLRLKMKVTLLQKKGKWSFEEITVLAMVFYTPVSSDPKHPDSLILCGEHPEAEVKKALNGTTEEFSVTTIEGIYNPVLPFVPRFDF